MKLGPVLAMVLLLLLGLWLIWARPGLPKAPEGWETIDLRVGRAKGVLAWNPGAAADRTTYRVLLRGGWESGDLGRDQVDAMFGPVVGRRLAASASNPVFRVLNITSWPMLGWILVGFTAQLCFGGRTVVQWILSERRRESVVPTAYWWMALIGGAMLFTYFVWRQDPIGVLGQSMGVVIYTRNLRLIHKQRRRARRRGGADAESTGAPESNRTDPDPGLHERAQSGNMKT